MFKGKRKNIQIRVLANILFWLILILVPFLMFPEENYDISKIFKRNWLPLIQYALIFYLNYLIFLELFLFKKKYLKFVAINLIAISILISINWQLRDYLYKPDSKDFASIEKFEHKKPLDTPRPPEFMKPPESFFFIKDLFSFIVPIIFALAIKAMENWIKLESEKKEIENKNLESELQNLRYQIQPHFFFNSLNNIYSLVEISPSKAQEAIHNLSKLMRYLLYETSLEKVDLTSEIEFLKKFVGLMELRHDQKTTVRINFQEIEPGKFFVAPLLFIPLIENAYKHGISTSTDSFISFEMKIVDNKLNFNAVNSNFPKTKTDESGSGIGIDNLKKRLDLIYPGSHEFSYRIENELFKANLNIKLD